MDIAPSYASCVDAFETGLTSTDVKKHMADLISSSASLPKIKATDLDYIKCLCIVVSRK